VQVPAGQPFARLVSQGAQVVPAGPHSSTDHAVHVPLSQQELAQVPSPAAPHADVHAPAAPQVGVSPPQTLHVAPFVPQAPFASPVAHVPALQHPPLQPVVPEPHALEHACVVALHASPDGQSVALPQPHVPFVRHAWPFTPASPVQSMHVEPFGPHWVAFVPG
jgi:hypothetical protein